MKNRPAARVLLALALLAGGSAAQAAVNLATLWDFQRPEQSERRFRAALQTAQGDDALVLRTQIARTHGLRGDFMRARRELQAMAPAVAQAGAEVRVRHALELGRTWASAAHTPAQATPAALSQARTLYSQALALARQARLDGLAVDAIHMMAFVDTAPADQLRWGREALALVQASTQPEAQRWEASIRNNIGEALNQLGRPDEALPELQRALALREQGGHPPVAVRSARWMVAWTLRLQGRSDEALAMQLALEREADAAGEPDADVIEELEMLYRQRGDAAQAERYGAKLVALRKR